MTVADGGGSVSTGIIVKVPLSEMIHLEQVHSQQMWLGDE